MGLLHRFKVAFGSRSSKAESVTDVVRDFSYRFNNPSLSIIDDAVDIIIEKFHPVKIIIYGPTAKGYVGDRKVNLVVIVKDGDTREIQKKIVWELALDYIDGDVTVYTVAGFDRCVEDSYTVAYDAMNTGRVVYGA